MYAGRYSRLDNGISEKSTMSYSFNEAKAAFADDQIRELSEDPSGYRFLLLRSLSRAEAMRMLARNYNCNVSGIP
ncbi:MAG: hypothetical protein D3921_02440, partial [Candidatus Electrothrix sp. AW1]|nr:hypothetical protein [Candidatus Electrothrix gigas]